MSYIYETVKEKVIDNQIGDYITYGIEVKDEHNHTIGAISDVSVDYETVAHITALCNEHELEPIHLIDVIDDMITNDI